MEHKQFISDALNRSPQPNLSFQADKFTKLNNVLSIPDTIQEQSSAELSGDSLKMEAPTNDDKENININQQVMCNEFSNNSKIIVIDNSFIKNCERKLLESSNSDEEKASELANKSGSSKQSLEIPRTLVFNNDSISTPPSALRKEISILRSELAAADEFHDFEIQLLQEEKLVNEVDLKNYLEVLEKNAALMELYTTLKNEYDEYRREQEKMRHELQSKTADCLESLCSQIEASDSSLNFSSASFVSFNGGIKSSTMLEDISEVEATVMHDGTVLATDPLSITNDGIFKTPVQTPMRSTKKLFPQESNLTARTPVVKEVKERIDKRESTIPLDSEYNIQLLNLEAALFDKVKEVENLEQRLFKVEDMSGVLKSECERMKESLSKKTEQLNELTQKLFTETISLNPALKDSLTDVPGVKLLFVFIETIMEKCKNIQDELITKHSCEKTKWEAERKIEVTANENLQEEIKSLNERLSSQQAKLADLEDLKMNLEKKLTDAENTLLTREIEMRILQTNIRQAQEDFSSTAEALSKLESQLSLSEAEKKEVENRCQELEETIKNLKDELEVKEKLPSELDSTKSALESIQKENENLKQMIQQSEELIADLKSESMKKLSNAENTIVTREEEIRMLESKVKQIQEDFNAVTETLSNLQSQYSLTLSEKETVETRCRGLEENVKKLNDELELKGSLLQELQAAASTNESIRKENEDLKHMIQQSEEAIARLQSESLQNKEAFSAKLKQEIESLKSEGASRLSSLLELLEECKGTLRDAVSSTSEMDSSERTAFDLFSEKLDNCPDTELSSAVKAIIEFVKEDWDSKRKVDLNLIEDLRSQTQTFNEKASETESKLTEILAQNNEFSKLCKDLKEKLREAEGIISLRSDEITSLRKQEDVLKQLEGDLALFDEVESSDLPYDRIEKLITKNPELRGSIDTEERKMVSVFVETLTKTCKGIQNELIKKIESKKIQWESQRNVDLNLIDSLQNEIKVLTEKAHQQETRITEINLEKEDLQKVHDNMTNQMTEAQKIISRCNEEIRILRSQETTLKQTKEELAVAGETILTLKSQLTSTESIKVDVETRCRELEGTIEEFKRALDSSENLHNVTKSTLETVQKKNEKLMEMIDKSEKVIDRLKSESCQHNNEELFREIESLKSKENHRFSTFFEILENCKKQLKEMISSNVESRPTENTAFRLISERLTETADLQLLSAVEAIVDFMKVEWDTQRNHDMALIENLQNQIRILTEKSNQFETKISEMLNENSESNKLCEDLKNQLRETEGRLSLREAEIVILKKQEDVFNEMKETIALADETISKLNTQLTLIEAEKKEIEDQYHCLEEAGKKFKDELEFKDKLLIELQAAVSTSENIRKENDDLKQMIQEYEETINRLKFESSRNKEELIQEIESLKNEEKLRFNNLLEILEECKQSVADSVSFSENGAFDLFYEKLDNCPDPMLSSAVKAAIGFVKEDWDSKRKVDLNLIEDLRNQIKTLKQKSEEECEDLKAQLHKAEGIISVRSDEITSLRKQEDVLKQLEVDLALFDEVESSDLPYDKIEKLITKNPELRGSTDTEERKIVTVFVETLTKTCKGIQNELIKKIESKKIEWESQRNVDLNLIDSLQNEIKVLTEKAHQQETRITEINLEKEDLQKVHDNMTNQMTEAQKIISSCNEEIRILRSQETTLKQTKEELAVADETILTLKSRLVSTESEKAEIELRCEELEKGTVRLKAEIDTKETIIQGLDELKLIRERTECENNELKQKILQSEEVILELKKGLQVAKEEQNGMEMRIKSLLDEIDVLRKEKINLTEFSEKLEKLEKSNKDLIDIFSDVQSHLDLPEDTMTKLLSGSIENKKIFSEKINNLVKAQTEGLKVENKNLKLSNENLKEKVKQLTKLLCETASADMKEELSNLNVSQVNPMTLRSRSNKSIDLCVRRLDKLEDINHNLTELLTRILTMTEFPDLEKLRLCSVRDYPNITKKVVAHINSFQGKLKELKEENAQLDEECETYSNIIKDLKKEAVTVWRTNKEKTEAMESDISRLQEEKSFWENEKQELVAKISKLENECQKLKSTPKAEGPLHSCSCGNEFKKINDLKRTILIKEQKLLELQDVETKASSYKSQIEYLKSALEREKKKVGEEKEKCKKLQNELDELTKNQKQESKKDEQNEVLEELRMRGTISGGVVQEFVDKEKIRKLSKDIGILKEMCRARYAEIKRLEAVNASLRNSMPKNSNQMDSPIRSRGYNTRSKNPIKDVWKSEITGKENSPARSDVL